jgi:hypothetical protein
VQQTSFGELHLEERGVHVQQRSLKLINLGTAAIAYAGDQQMALAIVGSLKQWLDRGCEVLSSFRRALDTNGPPQPDRMVAFLLAFHDSDGPRLVSFDSKQWELLPDVQGIGQIGSIGQQHKLLSEAAINAVLSLDCGRDLSLSAVLAFVQSYGIHTYLLQHGVGGFFAGIASGVDGVAWHPDIAYQLYDADQGEYFSTSEGVVSVVRENALAIRTNVAATPPSVFTVRLGDESEKSVSARAEAAYQACLERSRSGRFYAVAMINRRYPRVTLIEMRHQTRQRELVLDSELALTKDGVGLRGVKISPSLMATLVAAPPEEVALSMNDPSLHVVGFQPFESMS